MPPQRANRRPSNQPTKAPWGLHAERGLSLLFKAHAPLLLLPTHTHTKAAGRPAYYTRPTGGAASEKGLRGSRPLCRRRTAPILEKKKEIYTTPTGQPSAPLASRAPAFRCTVTPRRRACERTLSRASHFEQKQASLLSLYIRQTKKKKKKKDRPRVVPE